MLRRLTEANAAVVTFLAFVSALVVGAILILVTTPAVLQAWGAFGSAPGAALSVTGHTIGNAYSALFTGSIFDPSTLGNAISTRSRLDGGLHAALRDPRLGDAAHPRRHRRSPRVQHRGVQHRRPGTAHRRRPRRPLRRLRRPPPDRHPPAARDPRRGRRRSDRRLHPRLPEGDDGGPRGHHDHHAELHLPRPAGLPAHGRPFPAAGAVELHLEDDADDGSDAAPVRQRAQGEPRPRRRPRRRRRWRRGSRGGASWASPSR